MHVAEPAKVELVSSLCPLCVCLLTYAHVKEEEDSGSEPDCPWLCSSPQPAEGHLRPDRLRRGKHTSAHPQQNTKHTILLANKAPDTPPQPPPKVFMLVLLFCYLFHCHFLLPGQGGRWAANCHCESSGLSHFCSASGMYATARQVNAPA